MLPESSDIKSTPLSACDFSDLLTATLPGIPRARVVKFNNSWLYIPEESTEKDKDIYLVAYRAMVYRYYLLGTEDGFAPNLPSVPGVSGTPWAHGWGSPFGNAIEEATVPEDRHGRYFDGIGIAKIEVGTSLPKKGGLSVKVLSDQIIENSDGYEDPRIFWYKKKVMIHAHRFHPDITRGAGRPSEYPGKRKSITRDETPGLEGVKLPKPSEAEQMRAKHALIKRFINQEKTGFMRLDELRIKVAELKSDSSGFSLENEVFYGLNASQKFEKNFGFFEHKGLLNAIYDVAPYNKAAAFMEECERYPGHIKVKMTESADPGADCFLKLQNYLEHLVLEQSDFQFSTGSPLIPTSENHWLGIGHVKFDHKPLMTIMRAAYECMLDRIKWRQIRTVTAESLLKWCTSNQDIVFNYMADTILTNYLAGRPDRAAGRQKIFSFFKTGLARISAELICHHRSVRICKAEHGQPVPIDSKRAIFLHPDSFYFNFLYEVSSTPNGYRIKRFSDAFVLTDPDDPCFLQFATGLATTPDGYLISYGENDHRACMTEMYAERVEALLKHGTRDFRPKSYDFHIEEIQKSVL